MQLVCFILDEESVDRNQIIFIRDLWSFPAIQEQIATGQRGQTTGINRHSHQPFLFSGYKISANWVSTAGMSTDTNRPQSDKSLQRVRSRSLGYIPSDHSWRD